MEEAVINITYQVHNLVGSPSQGVHHSPLQPFGTF